jgi:hypothetical protein
MRNIILFLVSCLGLAGVSVALAQEASRPELKSVANRVSSTQELPGSRSIPANAIIVNADDVTPGSNVTPNSLYGWTQTQNLPSEYQYGYVYRSPAFIPTGVPTAGVITSVLYSWSLGRTIPGQIVYLCYNSDGTWCYDASALHQLAINDFNGLSANHSFWFFTWVNGSGMINPPSIGGSGTVTVTYSY